MNSGREKNEKCQNYRNATYNNINGFHDDLFNDHFWEFSISVFIVLSDLSLY